MSVELEQKVHNKENIMLSYTFWWQLLYNMFPVLYARFVFCGVVATTQ